MDRGYGCTGIRRCGDREFDDIGLIVQVKDQGGAILALQVHNASEFGRRCARILQLQCLAILTLGLQVALGQKRNAATLPMLRVMNATKCVRSSSWRGMCGMFLEVNRPGPGRFNALGALVEVVRRGVLGSEPQSTLVMGSGMVAPVANATCLVFIAKKRDRGAPMTASYTFSTNDVIANLGVVAAGAFVAWTGSALPDLVIGTVIGLIVLNGARLILQLR